MKGIVLAFAAALLISPDTLLMRLSGLDGFAMMAWRGLLTAAALLTVWLAVSGHCRGRDLAALGSLAGVTVVVAHFLNAALFSLSIAVAPVPVVLMGVATAPVFSAIFARILTQEPTPLSTRITIAVVLGGIALAVFGGPDAGQGRGVSADPFTIIGALGGLCVAASLALVFAVVRMRPDLPILLTVGVGSLCSGLFGIAVAGDAAVAGNLLPMAISGLVLLPATFFMLSLAARFTHPSNVSLMLLLETVLGPMLVWAGVKEAPTAAMLAGGAVVVTALAVYLIAGRRRIP